MRMHPAAAGGPIVVRRAAWPSLESPFLGFSPLALLLLSAPTPVWDVEVPNPAGQRVSSRMRAWPHTQLSSCYRPTSDMEHSLSPASSWASLVNAKIRAEHQTAVFLSETRTHPLLFLQHRVYQRFLVHSVITSSIPVTEWLLERCTYPVGFDEPCLPDIIISSKIRMCC